MSDDEGMFSLTVDQSERLIGWARTHEIWDADPWDKADAALLEALYRWRDRHREQEVRLRGD